MPDRPATSKLVFRDPAILPDSTAMGALTLQRLQKGGVIGQVEKWLPLSRNGGYTMTTLFAALVVYLLAGSRWGIRPFLTALEVNTRRRIAALVGRRLIPTASSLSRALGGLTHPQVHSFLDKLLPVSLEGSGLLDHLAVQHLDASGAGWHVVDVDPTVKAIRQRDLPAGEEYFEGKRRSVGEAGYTGRKRGEIRMRSVPMLHDGAGIWLGLRLLAEEGTVVPVLRELVDITLATLGRYGVPAGRVIIRGDGEFGSVGALKTVIDQGACVAARISRYGLLNLESVAATFDKTEWFSYRPGESGRGSEVADLGTFQLVGSTPDHPHVEVRVVARRVPASSDEVSEGEKGVRHGGFRVEMFATNLDAATWPAPDLLELVHGRASIENRFLQEDHELDLDRTFSQNPAGQECVRGIGMFLWNEQVCSGWKRRPAAQRRPGQMHRPPRPLPAKVTSPVEASAVDSPDSGGERAVALHPPEEGEQQPLLEHPEKVGDGYVETDGGSSGSGEGVPAASTDLNPAPDVREPARDLEAGGPANEPVRTPRDLRANARKMLGTILDRAFSDVGSWEGWSIDPLAGHVRCAGGRVLTPFTLNIPRSGSTRLAIRTLPHACLGCPLRPNCFPDDRTTPHKQISRTVTVEEVTVARKALETLRRPAPPPASRRPKAELTEPPRAPAPTSPLHVQPVPYSPGPWISKPPTFLPAVARKRVAVPPGKVVRVEIRDVIPPLPRRPDPLLAANSQDRAHRRKTRREISSNNRLNTARPLRITVEAT